MYKFQKYFFKSGKNIVILTKMKKLTQYFKFTKQLNPIKSMEAQNQKEQLYFVPLSSHEMYQSKIQPLLKEMSLEKLNINQVIKKLKLFEVYLSLDKYQKDTQFNELKKYNQNIALLFGKIAKFILEQEDNFKQKRIKLLLQSSNNEIQLTKEDVIYLMSLMALNLVPPQEHNKKSQENLKRKKRSFPYPYDFGYIFSGEEFKTRTIIQYFKQHLENDNWKNRNEKFTIKRKYLTQKLEDLLLKHQIQPMVSYDLRSDTESIEDFTGNVKVDFANKYIGGGALTQGCVQEEIMFANHPQLFISVIFCEAMNDKESIFFQGFRKYSKNKGYGWTTKYDGQQVVDDETYKRKQFIIAIDALHFATNKDLSQFKKEMIDREVLKAYVGFYDLPQKSHIVTGNWGCGAFNGDVRLKFLIQWIACSLAKKHMIYCPFGHGQKIVENESVLNELKNLNVDQVYRSLIKAGGKMIKRQENIFSKLKESFVKKQYHESIMNGKKIIHLD